MDGREEGDDEKEEDEDDDDEHDWLGGFEVHLKVMEAILVSVSNKRLIISKNFRLVALNKMAKK